MKMWFHKMWFLQKLPNKSWARHAGVYLEFLYQTVLIYGTTFHLLYRYENVVPQNTVPVKMMK